MLSKAAPSIPDHVCGHTLDPQLSAFLKRTNGMSLRGENWGWWWYGLGTPNDLVESNESMRRIRDDFNLEPYVAFAIQEGYACYLATIPALGRENGTQPVVYLDTYEDLVVVPVASSVEAACTLLAAHLERAGKIERSVFEATHAFPWEIPDLVSADTALVSLLNGGALEAHVKVGADDYHQRFIDRVRHASNLRS